MHVERKHRRRKKINKTEMQHLTLILGFNGAEVETKTKCHSSTFLNGRAELLKLLSKTRSDTKTEYCTIIYTGRNDGGQQRADSRPRKTLAH